MSERTSTLLRVTPFFRWYDIWIGAFIDVSKRTIYVCPLPMLGLKIELPRRADTCVHGRTGPILCIDCVELESAEPFV